MQAVQQIPAMPTNDAIPTTDPGRAQTTNRNNTSEKKRCLKFKTKFCDWIVAQNSWGEKQGIPDTELRHW